jgi:hypothetical protein
MDGTLDSPRMLRSAALSAALAARVGGLVTACGGDGEPSKIAFVRSFETIPGDVSRHDWPAWSAGGGR